MAPLWHYSFLILVLDGCNCWVSCHGRFTPQIMGTGNSWVAQAFCGEEKNLCPRWESNPNFPVLQPITYILPSVVYDMQKVMFFFLKTQIVV